MKSATANTTTSGVLITSRKGLFGNAAIYWLQSLIFLSVLVKKANEEQQEKKKRQQQQKGNKSFMHLLLNKLLQIIDDLF